ncbi:MAG TPA: Txe/YoeB family addiction module toxin [Verrucomicrobiota bacterium]|nr:Txe/YoeB family addiction module toxin [Verrucomicrobiales bacterium]HRI16610.1 Txe/YoeB family addiction module toxin [Verrucomicrobiota bacterium]
MNLTFSPQAWEDYTFWPTTDPKMVSRINQLLKDIIRSPHSGIGKLETLKHAFRGYWSRHIDSEHRLVYRTVEGGILIAQARFHYGT